MGKKFTLLPLLSAGLLISATSIAAPVDDITMEVIEADTVKASDALNEIALPAQTQEKKQLREQNRHENRERNREGMNMDEERQREQAENQYREMNQYRESAEESRQEMNEAKEAMENQKEEMKGKGHGM
jgi:hypothetical protein